MLAGVAVVLLRIPALDPQALNVSIATCPIKLTYGVKDGVEWMIRQVYYAVMDFARKVCGNKLRDCRL